MYRADHVGSFLRPREVLDARSDPGVTPERLAEIEDRHILRVLARQKDLGLEIFTDGELRRGGFMSDFYESIDGLDEDGSIARAWTRQPHRERRRFRAPAASRAWSSAGSGRRSASPNTRSTSSCGTVPATSR